MRRRWRKRAEQRPRRVSYGTAADALPGRIYGHRAGLRGPAFVLMKGGRIVAEAFGDLPPGELLRLLEHALPAARGEAPAGVLAA